VDRGTKKLIDRIENVWIGKKRVDARTSYDLMGPQSTVAEPGFESWVFPTKSNRKGSSHFTGKILRFISISNIEEIKVQIIQF
jgi:hypothetical protein